jgi:hypothetical protein
LEATVLAATEAEAVMKLTSPQAKVLDFLGRSGYNSSRAVAVWLYGRRDESERAEVVLKSLEHKSLVRHKGTWNGNQFKHISMWELTDEGTRLWRSRLVADLNESQSHPH